MSDDVVTLDQLTPYELTLVKPREREAGRVDRATIRQRGQALAGRVLTDGTVVAERRAGDAVVTTAGHVIERGRTR